MTTINGVQINIFSRLLPEGSYRVGGARPYPFIDSGRAADANTGATFINGRRVQFFGSLLPSGDFNIGGDSYTSRGLFSSATFAARGGNDDVSVSPNDLLGGLTPGTDYSNRLESNYANNADITSRLLAVERRMQDAINSHLVRIKGVPEVADRPGLIDRIGQLIPILRNNGDNALANELQADFDHFTMRGDELQASFQVFQNSIDNVLSADDLSGSLSTVNQLTTQIEAGIAIVLQEDLRASLAEFNLDNATAFNGVGALLAEYDGLITEAQNDTAFDPNELESLLDKRDFIASTRDQLATPDASFSVLRDFPDPYDDSLTVEQLEAGIARVDSGLSYLRNIVDNLEGYRPPTIAEKDTQTIAAVDRIMEPVDRAYNILINRYDRLISYEEAAIAAGAGDPAQLSALQTGRQQALNNFSAQITTELNSILNTEHPGARENLALVRTVAGNLQGIMEDIIRADAVNAQQEFAAVVADAQTKVGAVVAAGGTNVMQASAFLDELQNTQYSVLQETLTPATSFDIVDGIASRVYAGVSYINDRLLAIGADPLV